MKTKHIKTVILLFFGIILCTCTTNEEIIYSISNSNRSVKQSSQGIYLEINNVPEETIILSVYLFDITANDKLYTGTFFKDNELEQIKKSGFLICPFVRNGHEYNILISFHIFTENGSLLPIETITTTAIADGGIHIINNPKFVWDKTSNIVTLSERPVFSKDGISDQNNTLDYSLVFQNGEIGGKYGVNSNELAFNIDEDFNSFYKWIESMEINGNVTVFADVAYRLKYENINWSIVFAESEHFTYQL
jgi:hypothetical protein